MNTPANNKTNTRNLIASCSAITVFGLAFGMTSPLLSLIMQSRDVPAGLIGVNSALMPVGILLFSPVIPFISERWGSRKVALIAALATALCIVAYKLFDNLSAWFVIRLINGMSISTLFVLSEAWIVGSTVKANRGKVVAIYASVLSASFAAGPALIGILGIEGWTPFIIGTVVILLGMIPIALIHEEVVSTAEEAPASGILAFAPKAPMLIAAVGCFAIFDAATLSLLPVYGVENGLTQSSAAFALTALIAGNIFLQLPIGWLADKFPARSVLFWCAAITAGFVLLLPFFIHSPLLWPLLVIVGSTGYGIYTVSLKSLGDRFSGRELINGTSAFAVMWGIGALFGSLSAGWSLSLSVKYGLPILLIIVYSLLAAGLLWRQKKTMSNH